MYFSRATLVSALMGFAAAQASIDSILASETASAPGSMPTGVTRSMPTGVSGSTTPAGMVNTHIVNVGGPNGSLIFSPSNVRAQAGDLVQFQFHAKNHSVAQSTFDKPCVPIQNVMANKTDAFYSGFMPTDATFESTANILTYTIRVNDDKPVWFYCSQAKHCQAGMVGAINAPESGNKTMAAFAALAAQAPENLSPGQGAGPGGASPSGTFPGNTPISPSGLNPAQQSLNAAPVISSQSFFGLGAAAVAAFAIL